MASQAQHTKQRAQILETVGDALGPEGKVREGIYTSYGHYRPLVVTSRRLLVINAGRTPFPRGLLAEFPLADVRFVDVVPARFGQSRVLLDLPDVGTVPFDLGRYDVAALSELRAAVGDR